MTIVSDCILYDKMSYSVILYCLLLFSVIMQVSSCADVKLWRRVFGFRVWGSGFGVHRSGVRWAIHGSDRVRSHGVEISLRRWHLPLLQDIFWVAALCKALPNNE